MIKLNKSIIFLLLICLSLYSSAKTIFEAQNGDTINATVSVNDLTRIEIMGQKIIKDFSSANISKKITKPLGQIYLIPNINTSFNLYIVSDSGNTYNLHLTPSKFAVGDSIIIKPDNKIKHSTKPINFVNSSYQRNINYLLQIMYLNKDDDGQFSVNDINQGIITYNNLDSVLLRKYTNSSLIGYVILLKNVSKSKILLNEAEFYAPHTLAVAIENSNLLVNDFTRVFIIKEGE
jgi:hypothetical protein